MTSDVDRALRKILQEEIIPNKGDTKLFRDTYDSFMQELKRSLRESPSFGPVFSKSVLSGSTADELRVVNKNEFDVQIIMKDICGNVVMSPSNPGFVRLAAGGTPELAVSPRTAVKNLHRAVCAASHQINQRNSDLKVGPPQRGNPAVTLSVSSQKNGVCISIDLVPIFELNVLPYVPCLGDYVNLYFSPRLTSLIRKAGDNVKVHIVSKAPKDSDTEWRLDVNNLTKILFKDRADMKNSIRIIKFIRNIDCQSEGEAREAGVWCHLSSFMIKNEHYWQDEERGSEYWRQCGLDIIVVEIFHPTQIWKTLVQNSFA